MSTIKGLTLPARGSDTLNLCDTTNSVIMVIAKDFTKMCLIVENGEVGQATDRRPRQMRR